MGNQDQIIITTRDKMLRSWENSKELVRDYQCYAQEIQDDPRVAELFSGFAEEEANHAAKLLKLLHEYQG